MLRGGYLNDGKVMKQGKYVVRRQDHPWPRAVDEALHELASRGFKHCPQPVARIDACSVMLTYLPGRALGNPVPRWAASSGTLVRATRFVSEFSIAAHNMRPSVTNSDWLSPSIPDGDDLVHGDPHPTNLIFSVLRQPTGLIDFELATLGPGIWNLVSLIFTWAPLEPVSVTCWRDATACDPRDRIQTILQHWHIHPTAPELVDACHDFIRWRKSWIKNLADMGNTGAQHFAADPDFNRRHAHAIRVVRSVCNF